MDSSTGMSLFTESGSAQTRLPLDPCLTQGRIQKILKGGGRPAATQARIQKIFPGAQGLTMSAPKGETGQKDPLSPYRQGVLTYTSTLVCKLSPAFQEKSISGHSNSPHLLPKMITDSFHWL